MATSTFNTRVRMKRDTSSNWTTNNPVLLDGEIILVDTNSGELRFKVGDGVKSYTQLPFTDEPLRELISTKEAFWATYGDQFVSTTTTSAQIEAAYQAGKIVLCEYDGIIYRLTQRTSATDHTFTAAVDSPNITKFLNCRSSVWSNATLNYTAPSPASTTPIMDGTAAVGTSTNYARADHIHPSDTSKSGVQLCSWVASVEEEG